MKERNANIEGYIPYAEFHDFKVNELKNQILFLKENEKTLLSRINSLELKFDKVSKENIVFQKIIEDTTQIIEEYKTEQKRTQKIIEDNKQIMEEYKIDKKITQILLENYEKEKKKTNKIIEEDKKITSSILENHKNIISNYEKIVKKKRK